MKFEFFGQKTLDYELLESRNRFLNFLDDFTIYLETPKIDAGLQRSILGCRAKFPRIEIVFYP
jgi:hypothetical protein